MDTTDRVPPADGSASSLYDASSPPFDERPLPSAREANAGARAGAGAAGDQGPALAARGGVRLAAALAAALLGLLVLRRRRRRA